MEVTMKSSYFKRNGHERLRSTKASLNQAATLRRETALARLRFQLSTGTKFRDVNDKEGVPLEEDDIKRIMKEVATLEERIRLGK